MQFSIVKLFHHKSFGLDAPHYAVVADMPADMGGGQRVVDMFATDDVESAEKLREAFANAKNNMPHRVSPEGGGEIDFYALDHKGQRVKQNTAYVPAKSLTGERFEESLLNWLSWRARVGLWRQDGKRPSLSEKVEARILETVMPVRDRGADRLPVSAALAVCAVPQKRNDYLPERAPVPLTARPAPL